MAATSGRHVRRGRAHACTYFRRSFPENYRVMLCLRHETKQSKVSPSMKLNYGDRHMLIKECELYYFHIFVSYKSTFQCSIVNRMS
jgi:hypothetical protein